MNSVTQAYKLVLEPADLERLARLCGPFDEHLRQIEQRIDVRINNRGHRFELHGDSLKVRTASEVLQHIYKEAAVSEISAETVHLFLQESGLEELIADPAENNVGELIQARRKLVRARGKNQLAYVHNIRDHDISFGIGPAGTGKTYLAVACAVEALDKDRVRRILLVRPAVEAGEKLGFLPGDLAQKIDPYLRPLYDALYEMMGFEQVEKLIERNVIEVAPLAFMRGRTLNNAFIILDESQNTTAEQMKMFLTRLGFGSTAVITGDATQVDLPRGTQSGLVHACNVLNNVPGIAFTHFLAKDVVRHPLVQRIVEAYDKQESMQ